MPRQILAVAFGFVLWSAVWLGYNAILQAMDILPPDKTQLIRDTGVLLALLVGSALASLLAGYVTAVAANKASKQPVIALGLLLVSTGVFVQAQFWELMPLWYHLSFLALLLPVCIVGARYWNPQKGNP